MLMPSIFGENLFDDDWMNFPFNDEFWGKKNPLYGKHAQNMMKTDIRETDGSYELDVDLPGFKKDEIKVQLKDGYLTLAAAKGLDKDEKDKEGNYIRRERYAGSMCRSFYVGDAVSEEDIHAKYEDGILKLSVPSIFLPFLRRNILSFHSVSTRRRTLINLFWKKVRFQDLLLTCQNQAVCLSGNKCRPVLPA